MSPRRSRQKPEERAGGSHSPEDRGTPPEIEPGGSQEAAVGSGTAQPPDTPTPDPPSSGVGEGEGTIGWESEEAARARAGEWILQFAHEKLLAQANQTALAARALLTAEGVAWEAVPRLPVGVLGDLEECRAAFCRERPGQEKFADYWLNDRRVANALIGCVRDAGGTLVTLWARPIHAAVPALLCRRMWQDTVGAYGVDVLAQLRPPHVLAVERLTDALALQSHGLEPVIAFGRRFDEVPVERWAELLRWGVVQITLLPAGPTVSMEVFRNVRRRLRGVGRCPELWVLPTRRVTLGVGRLVALVGRKEFLELVRHHRVALVGRKQLFKMRVAKVPGGLGSPRSPISPLQKGLSSAAGGARPEVIARGESHGPDSREAGAPGSVGGVGTLGPLADWLDFD